MDRSMYYSVDYSSEDEAHKRSHKPSAVEAVVEAGTPTTRQLQRADGASSGSISRRTRPNNDEAELVDDAVNTTEEYLLPPLPDHAAPDPPTQQQLQQLQQQQTHWITGQHRREKVVTSATVYEDHSDDEHRAAAAVLDDDAPSLGISSSDVRLASSSIASSMSSLSSTTSEAHIERISASMATYGTGGDDDDDGDDDDNDDHDKSAQRPLQQQPAIIASMATYGDQSDNSEGDGDDDDDDDDDDDSLSDTGRLHDSTASYSVVDENDDAADDDTDSSSTKKRHKKEKQNDQQQQHKATQLDGKTQQGSSTGRQHTSSYRVQDDSAGSSSCFGSDAEDELDLSECVNLEEPSSDQSAHLERMISDSKLEIIRQAHVDARTTASYTAGRNWNEEFQSAVGMPENEDKWLKLQRLSQDFLYCSKTYGKIIISEFYLPDELKSIRRMGASGSEKWGIAGGSKYIACGIFFKFALDTSTSATSMDLPTLRIVSSCDG